MFAKSMGKTPAELHKALEQGKVDSDDFVRKFGQSLLEQYEETPRKLRTHLLNAGARLQKAITILAKPWVRS